MWLADGLDETILSNTSNIGLGGLCVHLNRKIPIGTKVDILINFVNPTTPFKCRGEIVRSKKENERFYNTGVEFEPLSELKHAFLDGKVSELIELEQKGKK